MSFFISFYLLMRILAAIMAVVGVVFLFFDYYMSLILLAAGLAIDWMARKGLEEYEQYIDED